MVDSELEPESSSELESESSSELVASPSDEDDTTFESNATGFMAGDGREVPGLDITGGFEGCFMVVVDAKADEEVGTGDCVFCFFVG